MGMEWQLGNGGEDNHHGDMMAMKNDFKTAREVTQLLLLLCSLSEYSALAPVYGQHRKSGHGRPHCTVTS